MIQTNDGPEKYYGCYALNFVLVSQTWVLVDHFKRPIKIATLEIIEQNPRYGVGRSEMEVRVIANSLVINLAQ